MSLGRQELWHHHRRGGVRKLRVPPGMCLALLRLLQGCVQLWTPRYPDFEVLEGVQSRAAELVEGVKRSSHE